jgi:hypothetical protein
MIVAPSADLRWRYAPSFPPSAPPAALYEPPPPDHQEQVYDKLIPR